MAIGMLFGKAAPELVGQVSHWEFVRGSQVNAPIALLIWLMIYPMMLKIDFSGLKVIALRPKGLLITLFVNWLVKPFSMAFLGWLFIQALFGRTLGWIDPNTAKNYTVGLIILAAAPCTAMVFVWSYLTDGDGPYTLAQVAINDLIMIFAFAPIVAILAGVSGVPIPLQVLLVSVLVFIVIPLIAGWCSRMLLIRMKGQIWFETEFLPFFRPVTIIALLLTLVLIFGFQAQNIFKNWLAVILLAVPIVIQVYFNSSLTYGLMRLFKVRHNVATPGALIGASNFFELAVAVAITLFGAASPAALATVVGVLVEVPVMLSVCGNADQACPMFPGMVRRYQWAFDDPARVEGSENDVLPVFRRVGDEIARVFDAYAAGLQTGKDYV
jgi:ACR3 family arsenite transporter